MATRQDLIRNLFAAGGELMLDMHREIDRDHPQVAAQVGQALQQGSRPVLVMQFSDQAPGIRFALENDYGTLQQVMTIAADAAPATRQ